MENIPPAENVPASHRTPALDVDPGGQLLPAVVLHSVQEDAPAVQEGREGGRPCEKGRKIRKNWRVTAATAGGERERARGEKETSPSIVYHGIHVHTLYVHFKKV